ncbi:SCO4225 family membrane protein [Streptomyces sp. NBC_00989]|uniref:SCO4225 family membrane protein n=1 Tax=Streptomyces sp. NBC_00989 TaxID=2903705 RepID=UPI00386610E6|nr:hypothetical protein OG714_28335 [Streptomyces sp. NBC_00989]
MPHASRPRRLLALATDNWPARAYLAVVGVSVAAMFIVPESPVAAGPLILTAPFSLLSVLLPFGPGTEGPAQALAFGFWVIWLLLCALVNAAVVGALVQRSTTPNARKSTTPAPPNRTRTRIRTLLAPAVDNWLARGYLALVAAALAFFLYAVYVSPDPGFAALWPTMATAPLGILALLFSVPSDSSPLAWLSPLLFTTVTALCGLCNAVLLGHLAHKLSTREVYPTA